jgi:hypothetical protein
VNQVAEAKQAEPNYKQETGMNDIRYANML